MPHSDLTHQRDFVRLVTRETPPSPPHRIYAKLVDYRFQEVIDNAFGRLRAFYDEKTWTRLRHEFVALGGTSPYIWQLPDAFRRFVAGKEERTHVNELFWYEWIDIALHKAPHESPLHRSFGPERPHRPASSSAFRRVHYPVHRRELDDRLAAMTPEPIHLLLYREQDTDVVMVTEITPFMYAVLDHLTAGLTPAESVRLVAGEYGESPDEVAAITHPALAAMHAKGILL